jgi:hypothetical protein
MTLPLPLSPAPSGPALLILRILAAHRLLVSARRPVALLLLAELTQLGAPTMTTLRSWSQIGCLLTSCAVGAGGEQFARFGRQATEIWSAALEELCAARPSERRVPRIIEATCTEVRL